MTSTEAKPRTWGDLRASYPELAAIDDALWSMRAAGSSGNRWPVYERAKRLVARYVGATASHSPADLQTAEAYEIALSHVCDVLEV